ncbi:hypothetical protein HYX18_02360 [Candidatus Woesearchaeota archaeon]|nr:hypothetical protein [Candidatus Woesearchaeota archaeon]
MPADDKVSRTLERLKLQEKKPMLKKSASLFRDISEMDFENKAEITENKGNELFSENNIQDLSLTRKIESLMRRIEEVISKMSAGTNYLMFYGQIQELEKQFLEMTADIESKKEKMPPQLFNRILYKKREIMKKRKK